MQKRTKQKESLLPRLNVKKKTTVRSCIKLLSFPSALTRRDREREGEMMINKENVAVRGKKEEIIKHLREKKGGLESLDTFTFGHYTLLRLVIISRIDLATIS